MEHTVLVVEDEQGIREAIAIYLKNQGYQVLLAENGKEGLDLIHTNDVHLAIVDIMMPIMDGITMTMELRKNYDFPVIFLSAKSEDIDKINGLNIGSMELLARVRSQLRRYEQILSLQTASKQDKTEKNPHRFCVGGLELDTYTKDVYVDGRRVKLTPKEFAILQLLMESAGRVYSAKQIYEQVWEEEAINTETIMVHVRKLREKIEVNPRQPQYLKVVWGVGYKIEKG